MPTCLTVDLIFFRIRIFEKISFILKKRSGLPVYTVFIKAKLNNSLKFDVTAKMETRNNLLQTLDHISLAEIFSYLNTSEVLLRLSLTCKDLHKIITTSPYIIKTLFENLFGRKLTKNDLSNLNYARFQEVLKDVSRAHTLHKPLPFYGFRGNCGWRRNSNSHLFDKVFEFTEDRSFVETDSGENFDIEGVLSQDFGRETKYIQNIISAIDQTDQAENPHLYSFKAMLQTFRCWGAGFPLPPNNPLEGEVKPLREFKQQLANSLQNQNDKYNIELPCQKMMKSVGLIQSCHLKRETQGLACPVKTLVAFASLHEEIRSSSLASLFHDCKTSDHLLHLLRDHQDELPNVTQTSIRSLADSSPTIQYINEEEDDVEFVVFSSHGKKQDVIPLFWVNFKKAINKDLFLNFRNCNFSGRYVMLKLIQCEFLSWNAFVLDYPRNIDMKFCCFYGPVIDL